MGTTEVVIVAIGGVIALAVIVGTAVSADPWHAIEYAPHTAKSLLPVLGIALFCGAIVLVASDKGEALFGALVLFELFSAVYAVLGRRISDPADRRYVRKESLWDT